MAELTLTKTRFQAGIWEGVLRRESPSPEPPELAVTHLDAPVGEVSMRADTETPGVWFLRIELPGTLLSDGVQTVLISDASTDEKVGSIACLAGETIDDDVRAEVDLLRAELDMLKRAFRRHCVETAD